MCQFTLCVYNEKYGQISTYMELQSRTNDKLNQACAYSLRAVIDRKTPLHWDLWPLPNETEVKGRVA